jgi:hypothetical protein
MALRSATFLPVRGERFLRFVQIDLSTFGYTSKTMTEDLFRLRGDHLLIFKEIFKKPRRAGQKVVGNYERQFAFAGDAGLPEGGAGDSWRRAALRSPRASAAISAALCESHPPRSRRPTAGCGSW